MWFVRILLVVAREGSGESDLGLSSGSTICLCMTSTGPFECFLILRCFEMFQHEILFFAMVSPICQKYKFQHQTIRRSWDFAVSHWGCGTPWAGLCGVSCVILLSKFGFVSLRPLKCRGSSDIYAVRLGCFWVLLKLRFCFGIIVWELEP